jgi:superfamily II DNA/RNA helicase
LYPVDRSTGWLVVVGTPGRLRDHIERGSLVLSALAVAVLDEADEMLDMGFREDLEEILDSTPADRRTFLFSATIAKEIASLAKRYQRDAQRIDTIRRDEAHGDIEYRAVRVAPNEIGSMRSRRIIRRPSPWLPARGAGSGASSEKAGMRAARPRPSTGREGRGVAITHPRG